MSALSLVLAERDAWIWQARAYHRHFMTCRRLGADNDTLTMCRGQRTSALILARRMDAIAKAIIEEACK